MAAFGTLLANLCRARVPYLYICTWEEDRLLAEIRSVAQSEALIRTPWSVFTWSLTEGIVGTSQTGGEETRAPLKALEFVERSPEAAIFVFKDFHVFLGGPGRQPDPAVIRKIRDISSALKRSSKPKNVIFVSPTMVLPTDLEKDITVVDFDLPAFAEVKTLLDQMIEANRRTGRVVIDLKPEEAERLAKAALGLTLQEAENAFARAIVEDGRLDVGDVEVILEEKRQVIKKTEILEFIKTDSSMDDVGGLENLKRWLRKRDKSWLDAAHRYRLPAPKGILITGVPGCGKSLVAKSISAAWQLPLLRLDIGRVFSGIVGSSEYNIRSAIKTAEAVAPSVLWIDEVEKGFGGTGTNLDSGTSTRVFGTFLTWMQEKSKPVFVVATSNNIHSLPPEFLRKGRFDEVFFVDLPTRKERMDIFALHLNKRLVDPEVVGTFRASGEVLARLADLTEGFSGAEIEQVVVAALFEAFSEDRGIALADLEKAIATTVPLSVTQAEQIQAIREWANLRAVAATRQEDRTEYATSAPESGQDVRSTRGGRTVDF